MEDEAEHGGCSCLQHSHTRAGSRRSYQIATHQADPCAHRKLCKGTRSLASKAGFPELGRVLVHLKANVLGLPTQQASSSTRSVPYTSSKSAFQDETSWAAINDEIITLQAQCQLELIVLMRHGELSEFPAGTKAQS